MATARTVRYQEVRHDLGRALRSLRNDCPPMEMARVLLSYDGPGQRLVGVRHDGKRVVYFQESSREAIAVFLGSDGLDKRGGRPIANLSRSVSLEQWVEKIRYYWGWRHPKFR